jgi:hypothetical protein
MSNPVDLDENHSIIVSPEVVHLSRFASRYKLYPDEQYATRAELCLHNGNVAERLSQSALAHMWRMLAFMLDSTGIDGLLDKDSDVPLNMMQYVMPNTIKALLEERAIAGDVQTCVAICEVLEIVKPDQTVRIADLEVELVREWYLSYIDLLRDMCLFSHATFLIRSCKDPYIGSLHQQSTTYVSRYSLCRAMTACVVPLPDPSPYAFLAFMNVARTVVRRCYKKMDLPVTKKAVSRDAHARAVDVALVSAFFVTSR